MRSVPAANLPLLHKFELGPGGVFASMPYHDEGGFHTVGWGHVILPTDHFHYPITQAQGDQIAIKDLNAAAEDLCLELGQSQIDDLTEGQYAALIDFVFNEGIGHFITSTLCHLIQNGKYDQAQYEFPRWVFGGNPPKVLPGLKTRRDAEVALWLS